VRTKIMFLISED
jgi:hypothetical protein